MREGVVKLPNVNMLVEMADMREANRSYDANLQTIKQTRDLISSTIDLLKSQSMISRIQNVSSLSVTRGLGSITTDNLPRPRQPPKAPRTTRALHFVLGNMATQAVDA